MAHTWAWTPKKSDPPKKATVSEKGCPEKANADMRYDEAKKVWDEMSEDTRKMRPQFDPDLVKPPWVRRCWLKQKKPPTTLRRFTHPWTELDYLCKKVRYWLYVRKDKHPSRPICEAVATRAQSSSGHDMAIIVRRIRTAQTN